nr:MAG TPA: hypothetical protein [Bacteriophage sp.]
MSNEVREYSTFNTSKFSKLSYSFSIPNFDNLLYGPVH